MGKLNLTGPLRNKKLTLDLDTLADGIYEVEVRASDEPSTGAGAAASDVLISDPFVIDRTRPTLENVIATGNRVTGVAKDRGSYVHDVAFAVDGGDFRTASPSDGQPRDLRAASHAVMSDDLERLADLLTTIRLGRAHEHHASIASTNDRALAWLAAGAPDGALVTADQQTAGRGRLGRAWSSPAGRDVYASVILRPGVPAQGFGALALAVGVGLREGVLAAFGCATTRAPQPCCDPRRRAREARARARALLRRRLRRRAAALRAALPGDRPRDRRRAAHGRADRRIAEGLDADGALRVRPREGGPSFRVESADVWLADRDQGSEGDTHRPTQHGQR